MNTNLDALIINSYAGSLVLGAQSTGLEIRGSYEDCGFGLPIQKLNFPKLKFVERTPWPKDNLSSTIVIAHPPCAAFSNQNNSVSRKGINTDAFKCHREVMDYSMSNRCAALAIESVPGALKAQAEYAKYARKYNYTHYFIHLNSASFGVSQWRPRVWMIFLRDLPRLVVNPPWEWKTVGDILQTPEEYEAAVGAGIEPNVMMKKLLDYFGKKFKTAEFNFEEFLKFENIGSFVPAVAEFLNIEKTREAVNKACGTSGLFGVRLPRKMDLRWFSPVILDDSFFFANGRPLTMIEYQRIMGFPDDFKWPENLKRKFTMYLSKGVAPPVAAWIAKTLVMNCEKTISLSPARTQVGAPGEILDIRPNTDQAKEAVNRSRNKTLPFVGKFKRAAV